MGGEQSRLVDIQITNNSGNTTMYNPSFQISPGQSSGSALSPVPLSRSEFLQLLTSSKIVDLKGLLEDEDEFLSSEMLQKILKCRRMDLTVVKKSS